MQGLQDCIPSQRCREGSFPASASSCVPGLMAALPQSLHLASLLCLSFLFL